MGSHCQWRRLSAASKATNFASGTNNSAQVTNQRRILVGRWDSCPEGRNNDSMIYEGAPLPPPPFTVWRSSVTDRNTPIDVRFYEGSLRVRGGGGRRVGVTKGLRPSVTPHGFLKAEWMGRSGNDGIMPALLIK